MRKVVLAALSALGALSGAGCDALVLDVARRPAPADVVAPVNPEPEVDDGGAACARTCVGGRRCVEGECLPHWLPIQSTEAINDAPRVGHFTVWTGREVLVWGGRAAAGEPVSFGDGVRFDPERGTLRAMSRIDAPAARFQEGDTAVWTGHEMLVLGGRDARGSLRDVAGYSPELDRWRLISAGALRGGPLSALFTGSEVFVLGNSSGRIEGLRLQTSGAGVAAEGPAALGPRTGHTALWTGAEVVVWGGADSASSLRGDGYRYIPTRARWREVRDVGTSGARRGHSAVWSSSEMLVFGGIDQLGRALAAPLAYVPALDAWRPRSAVGAPEPRQGHAAVWAGDAMLVWGGAAGSEVFSDGASYDPWDDAWTPLPPLPRTDLADGAQGGRAGAAAVWTGAELVVLGGENGTGRLDPYGWRYQR